eukprot:XP_019920977.1 PREDICTED: fatty acyl-CoA hydrolase precursor, medium chain isoform X1 [Crassostrea gigas]
MMKFYIFSLTLVASLVKGDDVVNAVEIKTTSGWVRGYEENFDDGKVFRFVKIPFAKPPIGKLRFRPPQPIGEWDGVQGISETKSPVCPQWHFPSPGFNFSETNEDCLYLDIYVPGKISLERNLSVIVWIFGGGFIIGAANQYRPQPMVLKGDVIVVTINYRLGLLGFFTMHDPLLSGNYGIMDQIEALRWIHNNIASFGGNPNSVTIFGESAGGMSISLLTLIPSNEGLFQRAISQSGVVSTVTFAKKEWEIRTKDIFLERTNCSDKRDAAETLDCLQKLPVENITNAIMLPDIMDFQNVSYQAGGLYPSVDGKLIDEHLAYPKSPEDKSYTFFRSLDFMSGTLDGEGNMLYMGLTPDVQKKYNFSVTEKIPKSVLCEMTAPVFVNNAVGNVPELAQEICDFYTTAESIDAQSNKVCEFHGDSTFIVPSNLMLSTHAKDNPQANTYQFLITKTRPFPIGGDPPSWFKGAGHADDLRFFFNFSDIFQIPDEKRKEYDEDQGLSEKIIQYWTNFAKFGNPNGENIPLWPSYEINRKQYIIFDTPIETAENLKSEATDLLSRILETGRRHLTRDEL